MSRISQRLWGRHVAANGATFPRPLPDANRPTVRPLRAAPTPAHDELEPADLESTAGRFEAEASRLLARANDLRQLAARIRAESEET
jgi:hypothetical protein